MYRDGYNANMFSLESGGMQCFSTDKLLSVNRDFTHGNYVFKIELPKGEKIK